MNRRRFLSYLPFGLGTGTVVAASSAIAAPTFAGVGSPETYDIQVTVAARNRTHPYALKLAFTGFRDGVSFVSANVIDYELADAVNRLASILSDRLPDGAEWVLNEWYPGVVDLKRLPFKEEFEGVCGFPEGTVGAGHTE